ncbi:hypothetical protein ACCO45_011160 [Purpureocillium lilacinum]|uniref:Uncharacterized protein n=1 Tax=Purpureocillium lilacinum TaxID=33203 RepID=A0ACC4DGV0_PURLI
MSSSSAAETINAYGPISSPTSSRRNSMASHATDSRKNSASEPAAAAAAPKHHHKSNKKALKVPTLIMPSIRWVN